MTVISKGMKLVTFINVFTVTMYAQWRTMEDYERMRKDPAPAPFLQEALTLATFEPGSYEVVETFAPSGG